MSVNTSNCKNNKTDLKSVAPPNIQTIVPMSRIKTIMKSSPEISIINQDTLYAVTLATEQFISCFTKETFKQANKEKNLDYKHFSNLVASDERFQFLSEIIPCKVKAREALAMIKAADNE